jgi:hypothetical protein
MHAARIHVLHRERDPKTATPAQIQLARKVQTGYQVEGVTGGLGSKEADKDKK